MSSWVAHSSVPWKSRSSTCKRIAPEPHFNKHGNSWQTSSFIFESSTATKCWYQSNAPSRCPGRHLRMTKERSPNFTTRGCHLQVSIWNICSTHHAIIQKTVAKCPGWQHLCNCSARRRTVNVISLFQESKFSCYHSWSAHPRRYFNIFTWLTLNHSGFLAPCSNHLCTELFAKSSSVVWRIDNHTHALQTLDFYLVSYLIDCLKFQPVKHWFQHWKRFPQAFSVQFTWNVHLCKVSKTTPLFKGHLVERIHALIIEKFNWVNIHVVHVNIVHTQNSGTLRTWLFHWVWLCWNICCRLPHLLDTHTSFTNSSCWHCWTSSNNGSCGHWWMVCFNWATDNCTWWRWQTSRSRHLWCCRCRHFCWHLHICW